MSDETEPAESDMGKTAHDLDDREDGIMILPQTFTCGKCGAKLSDYAYPQATAGPYRVAFCSKCRSFTSWESVPGTIKVEIISGRHT